MRRVAQRKQFRTDIKREKRRGKDIGDLVAVVELLVEQGALPVAYRPHRLSGEWRGVWECHIEPDWLLVYAVSEEECFSSGPGLTPIYSAEQRLLAHHEESDHPAGLMLVSR